MDRKLIGVIGGGLLLAGSLFGGSAQADDDFSLSLRFDDGSRNYCSSSVYGYGLYGNPYYYSHGYDYGYGYQPGLSLSYRNGDVRADFGNRLYTGRNRSRNRNYVNDFSYGYGETGNSLNDRPGYRLFIPQGLQDGSERVLPQSQYLGLPQLGNTNYRGHRGNCYDGCGCSTPYYGNYYHNGYPLVIQYGYPTYGLPNYGAAGYDFPARSDRVWTAPANPELGYYGDGRYRDEFPSEPEHVVNDNSVTNNYYYYGNPGPAGAAPPQAPAAPAAAPAPQAQPAPASPAQSYSTRFRTHTRLELTNSVTLIELSEEGRLSVGPENGPAQTVSAGADTEFGCFATWHSEHGLTLVFREGDSIMGAYEKDKGWWSEALGADVDFSQDVSISTMNGEPWLKFSNRRGERVIMKFAEGVWQTIGYGSIGK